MKDLVEYFELIAKWRYKPFFLLLVFLGILLGALYFPLPEGIAVSIETRGIIGLIVAVAMTAISWHYQQPPTVRKGHVGIIIAIKSEDEKTKGRISKDFVATCKKLLEESLTNQPFQLIELNDFFSEMATDQRSADELRMRCKGSFLMFGDIVQRQERGKKLYVLRLQGLVVHSPISPDNQSLLAQEMSSVLPLKKSILEVNELSGFEITTIQLAEATKYIIATAALLSHDFELAISLLEELQNAIKRLKRNASDKAIKKLIELIPKRLADAYRFASLVHFSRWEESRDVNELKESINWKVKYNRLVPSDNLELLLLRAIEEFVFNRDIEAAIKYINQCKSKSITNTSWKYSAAFLEAYRNNLDKAKQLYDAAISTESGHTIPFEVEGFIAWILKIEPQNNQLNFCLGYINEKLKNDLISARKYYAKFLSSPCQKDFSKSAIEHANTFMAEH